MLQPKKVKYRLSMRGVMKGKSVRGGSLEFGNYGLKSLSLAWLSARQIEAARKTISSFTKKGGKLWIRVFPHKPISLKPPEVRMGGGKAGVDHYSAVVKPGTVIFEVSGLTSAIAKEAFKVASSKLPFRTRFVEEQNL